MYIVRKQFHFSAAHRLYSPHLSEKDNEAQFGKCASPHYHGHNYKLEVAVTGDINPMTGMVINFDELKKIVQEHIILELDHKNLNLDADFLKGEITTAENLARLIWQRLAPHLLNVRLHEIILSETDDNVVIYRGD